MAGLNYYSEPCAAPKKRRNWSSHRHCICHTLPYTEAEMCKTFVTSALFYVFLGIFHQNSDCQNLCRWILNESKYNSQMNVVQSFIFVGLWIVKSGCRSSVRVECFLNVAFAFYAEKVRGVQRFSCTACHCNLTTSPVTWLCLASFKNGQSLTSLWSKLQPSH